MPVDADLNCTDVVSPACELKGLRTWKDICLVRNSLFQHQVRTRWNLKISSDYLISVKPVFSCVGAVLLNKIESREIEALISHTM